MDTTTSPVPAPNLLHRAFWLLLVPTVCGCGPWILAALPGDRLSAINRTSLVLLPALAALLVIGYRLLSPYPVRLWPFLPYVAAGVFLTAGSPLLVGTQPGSEYFLIAVELFGAYVLLPFLAFAGGLVSFVAIGDRYGGLA